MRVNVYLDDKEEALFNSLMNKINQERMYSANKYFKKYIPISKSEVLIQTLKKCIRDEKSEAIEKMRYHNEMMLFYSEKVSALKKGEEIHTLINSGEVAE